GDRRRWSFRGRHDDRRKRGRFSTGAPGRDALAVVAHGRSAGRAVLEQGGHAWGLADGGNRAVALASPRSVAELGGSPHHFFGPTKFVELDGPQRCFRDRKELVELRRF